MPLFEGRQSFASELGAELRRIISILIGSRWERVYSRVTSPLFGAGCAVEFDFDDAGCDVAALVEAAS